MDITFRAEDVDKLKKECEDKYHRFKELVQQVSKVPLRRKNSTRRPPD